MNKEPKSICEKHNLEVCEDCMRNGVWTFPDKAPDDILAETEYKIMAAIGNLDGEQMTNENGELFIKYIDVQNALSQTIIPAVSQLLLSTRAEAREEGYHAALDSKYGEKMHGRIIGATKTLTLSEIKDKIEKMKIPCLGNPEMMQPLEERIRNNTLNEVLVALSKKEI